MDEEKDKTFNDLRFRFDGISEELRHLRDEWADAHGRKDIERETELAHRESDLLGQADDVVRNLAGLMRQSRAA